MTSLINAAPGVDHAWQPTALHPNEKSRREAGFPNELE